MAGLAEHDDPYAVHCVIETPGADPCSGEVRWDPVHSLWNGGMMAVALIAGPATIGWGPLAALIVTIGATLLLGHSVGFHRRLIHRSFDCPKPVERFLVWFGTSVGMSGPLWMVRTHDLRDWAQRRPDCHPYLRHGQAMWLDGIWQLHCRLELKNPPAFDLSAVEADPFYRWLERTWMLQQVPIAMALFFAGGWPWVVWGVCVRVSASVTGHWFVGWFAHRQGPQTWLVEGAGVQAHDVPWAAIPTMGEAWHNNHHAYPGSARMGLLPGQTDWGFAFIQFLERAGLAWDVRTPDNLPIRVSVRPATAQSPIHEGPRS